MKRTSLLVLLLMVLALSCTTAFADVLDVTGLGTMETPYHMVTAVFVEYDEEVAAPGVEDYRVIDFAAYDLKEDYERRPYAEGEITAVYTNSEAALREDKTSVPGRFVVIELAPTNGSFYAEVDQLWKPKNIAGLATIRYTGESSQHTRTDWELFTIVQLTDVVNAAGEVIATKGVLPALPNGPISTPELEANFTQMFIPAANGTHNINFNLHLPKDYDATKEYPVMFVQSGGGGGLNYAQQDAEGNLVCLGCDISLDSVAIEFVRAREDLIVVAFQRWKNPPKEWNVDDVADYIQLNEYIRANYAVNQDRVYALASSAGTSNTSNAIIRRPDLWSGYVQCNGSFSLLDGKSRFTLYKDELMYAYVGYTADQIWEISNNPDNRLDQATIDEMGKCFDSVIENRIPVYFFDGVNTESGSSLNTTAAYIYVKERYEALGLSEAEIADLVRCHVGNNEEFHANGICEYHASSKLAVTDGYDVIDWILSR